ncbi:baseplate J/gp47 family protein [Maridesulfovibrio ferrireducens]|uniref:baseplate J/gp47 family protein n=1 Tax=Maridesulfovibrio ferrireducens TaxID=246191 RepID=UPI001A26FA76|nr:baseplate J/gp47 family protein [Maridesulfovibrio ferrireducens]MBI9109913.1 baseplate J/gp47 family protein [Maridesulfovibrio ferrireducens]
MTVDYRQMLKDAGVPTTELEMDKVWKDLNIEQGSVIQNDSTWSPFWKLITAIVTTPCKWLVDLLADTALPNTFLKTSSGIWLDIFAWGVDLERKNATFAQGFLIFTRVNSVGAVTIPAGTIIETPSISGYVYRLITSEEVAAADGELTFQIPVKAENSGAAYNLGPGYYSILPRPIPGIASVKNESDWLDIPGADKEQDEPFKLRAQNQFSAVGQYHHDAAYTADISLFAGIRPDYIYFEHDAPRGPGTANGFIMIDSGAPSQDFVDAINNYVRDTGHHGHGDDMVCFPMPLIDVAIVATVYPVAHLSEEKTVALLQGLGDMIRSAFRENSNYEVTQTFPFSRFSLSRLKEELHLAFKDLQSVEFSLNQDIVTGMNLPELSSLTVELGE